MGGDNLGGADEEGLFGQHAHKCAYSIVGLTIRAEGAGKVGDEVHAYVGQGA